MCPSVTVSSKPIIKCPPLINSNMSPSDLMGRYNGVTKSYGKECFDLIYKSKILIVGAGGIGCEVNFKKMCA